MGLLWAAYLSQAGHKVSLLTRNDAEYQTLKQQPLRCEQLDKKTLHPIVHIEAPDCLHPIENLLICVKAQQTSTATKQLIGRITEHSHLLLLQNGLDGESLLRQVITQGHSYLVYTTEAGKKLGHMRVMHTGIGHTFIGSSHHKNAQARQIARQLQCALSINASEDIRRLCFQKLIANCIINPLTALHNCLNGELLRLNNIDEHITHISQECLAIASAQGMQFQLSHCITFVRNIINTTAKNSSSMREDSLNQRPSEIFFINGYIVKQGKALGIDVPYNQRLLNAVTLLESQYPSTKVIV